MLSDRKNPSDEEHRRPRAAQGLSKAIPIRPATGSTTL
jgi:hypothetical protein